jgi:hypothetical protein
MRLCCAGTTRIRRADGSVVVIRGRGEHPGVYGRLAERQLQEWLRARLDTAPALVRG